MYPTNVRIWELFMGISCHFDGMCNISNKDMVLSLTSSGFHVFMAMFIGKCMSLWILG